MMFYGGCDVGSTTTKAVIVTETGAVAGHAITASTTDPEATARSVLEQALQPTGLGAIGELKATVGTGYGRVQLQLASHNISEITCHAVGVHQLDAAIRTVIDIGGQDVKAIALNDDGTVMDFAMNDKCAAGTGRFYEAMMRVFGTTFEAFSELSLQNVRPLPISSQCSVFAESEVISLISQKQSLAAVARGIQTAVAKRVFTLARRVGLREKVTIAGGCAKNLGLVRTLEEKLRVPMTALSFDSQLVGALGAAIIALRKYG
jgi:predicted CoA-substrate-specific enzyme activase